jgi:hypothetical protein
LVRLETSSVANSVDELHLILRLTAAYQRELYYWASPSAAAYWDSLTAAQPSSNCYTIAGPYWGGWTPPSNDWGIYFYEGGPGGYNCY